MTDKTVCFDYSEFLSWIVKGGETRRSMANSLGYAYTFFCTVIHDGLPMSSARIKRAAQILGIPDSDIGTVFFTLKV